MIDNYKTSGVNAAFGTSSHLDLHDTDMISCFLAFALGVFCGDPHIDIELSSGDHLTGRRHPDYDRKPLLLGRGIDLSKAYKQVSVAPQSARHSILECEVNLANGSSLYRSHCLLEPRPAFLHSTRSRAVSGL